MCDYDSGYNDVFASEMLKSVMIHILLIAIGVVH